MNDILRLISNALKPFGYHLRRHGSPNILKINNCETAQNNSNVKALRINSSNLTPINGANLEAMIVYVRTCVRLNRNTDKTKRITKATLEENTLRCLRSLVQSINHAHKTNPNIQLIALDDRSDDAPLQKITATLQKLNCEWQIKQTQETGQGNSLHEQFKSARHEDALVYFCEDDYLHEKDAILTCWNFYKYAAQTFSSHSLIYPQEHAVLYDDLYPSYLIRGEDRSWRTMRHATHTFITHSKIVDQYWDYFENTKYVGIRKKRKKGSEAKTTNKLFKHIPGFSPMRPAAIHLQFENTLPPHYNWRPLWDKMAQE